MFKNYLKTTINNIKKHRFFSIINILGLSIGIASSLFVTLHVIDEFSYDHFNDKGDRIYRVTIDGKLGDQVLGGSTTTAKLANTLRNEVAPVENATNVMGWGSTSLLYEDKKFIERKAIVVDSSFLQVFTYPLLHGNPTTALDEPNSIVLTEDLAIKYFGSTNEAFGKLMVVDGAEISFKVTGVAENVPDNSHLKFTALLSRQSFPEQDEQHWLNDNVQTYFVLKDNATIAQVDDQLEVLIQKYVSPLLKQFMGIDINEFRESGRGDYNLRTQALYDIHLYGIVDNELDPQGDISYIYILLAIGVFLLAIASINFMNLSTAKSANRAKEVGLRKTMGATRGQLIGQFLTESMVFSVLSAVLALLLVYMFLPSYNLLTGKFLVIDSIFEPGMLAIIAGIVLIVGVLAGSYPAFYLTSFEVIDVIKGKLNAGSKNKSIRGVLVTFQFWISIVLIISTAVVYQQLEYAQSKKIGIDKDQVFYVVNAFRLKNDMAAFKTALERIPEIQSLSYTRTRFPNMNSNSVYKAKGGESEHRLAIVQTDYDLQKVMGFKMVEGRYFSPDFITDSLAIIVNEATVAEMGWKNPLEEALVDRDFDGNEVLLPVIGVMKDFSFESVKNEIRPIMFRLTGPAGHLAIRFNGADYEKIIPKAEKEWDKLVPNEPFEYEFMAAEFDAMFRSEQRLMKLFTLLTGLAIFIAALGLFGLTAFTAEQRTKEIGIRKALGASVWQINTLLTKEFTKLVLVAFILAIYPVYYLMNGWLDNFAFRIAMGIWVFVMGGVVSFVISWLTVSFQAQKVARANPMDALKYE